VHITDMANSDVEALEEPYVSNHGDSFCAHLSSSALVTTVLELCSMRDYMRLAWHPCRSSEPHY